MWTAKTSDAADREGPGKTLKPSGKLEIPDTPVLED